MKKFIVLSIVLLMLAGFAITSSADDFTLYADQIIDVGTLTVEVIGTNLVVTYNITSPWVLGETHLYVGTSIPKKSAPGRFPYGPEDVVEEGKYVIDLGDFTDTLYIAAQAEVTNPEEIDPFTELPREETAWAEGVPIRSGKNWATYFDYIFTPLPTISSDDLAGPFTADEFGYFTVTTVNPSCGFAYSNVLFNYTIFGIDKSYIVSFKYDDGTATWYDAPVIQDGSNVTGFFGPLVGFPMSAPYDETTEFEIKINATGAYTVEITLDNLNSPYEVLAFFTEDVVIQ